MSVTDQERLLNYNGSIWPIDGVSSIEAHNMGWNIIWGAYLSISDSIFQFVLMRENVYIK